ncbi:MarR family transcriptional regulator [uncultured Williamsia sp.]|uniref:MarR family winged helix-turn-helix transcriptional regulator n=1 Tax=uncultured Williamsia sp. TaxID=259311 RepID=UPI00260706BA|nr:MarR family transcriptional regulator [uncultured Williamsia sp.]
MTRSRQDVAQLIKRVQGTHHRLLDSALSERGITLVQWDALRHLAHHPDASLHDLALRTFQSDQAFGTLARRMEDRGLVERTAGPGRVVRLTMTDAGRELLEEGRHVVENILDSTVGHLSQRDLDQLGDLLARVLDGVSAD